MARLSKMEISAIANKIAEDAKIANNQKNKQFRETEYPKWLAKFQKTKAYKSLITYTSVQDEVKELLAGQSSGIYINYLHLETVLTNLFSRVNKEHLKSVSPSVESIERDIIIAQAKNEDLDALIASLTEKYSK